MDENNREGDLAKLADLAKRIPDNLDRQAKLEKWNEARGVIRGVEKGCIPLKEHLGPEYRAFFESVEDTTRWEGDGGRKACKAMPTKPWKVRSPQARGLSHFGVRCEYVENKITALKNITRQKWEDTSVDRPAWMRAERLIKDMRSCTIEPATHAMKGICTLLSCTPGPREGVSALQTITGDQVLAAVKHRGYHDIDADTVSRLTNSLNSEQIHWFYCSMLDVFFWPNGAVKQYKEQDSGLPKGNIHLGDSGMIFLLGKDKGCV